MASLSILIVGCGIAGPTLASFLLLADIPAAQKPRITILERESNQKAHLRGQNIDIRGAGVTIIRKLGLEAQIRASTTGEEGVRMVDESNRIWTENPADRTGTIQTGTSDIEILRGKLAELCWKNSQRISAEAQRDGAAGIEYIFGDFLEEIQQHGSQVHVRFARSQKTRSFDLLVGADGMQSRTRKMVWGEEGESIRLKRLGMFAGFFSIPREEHDDNWRRWFHAPGRRGIMLRPDGLGMRSTILMYVVNDKDPRFVDVATKRSGGIQEQKALLEEYFHGAGWECDRIIREMMATDDFYYDAVSQVKMDSWSKGRVVLLGDAGYCASPISGLGTTLAFSAAYKLAGYLQPYIKGESLDLSCALAQYDEQMRPIVEEAQQLAPGMPHLINPETAWGIWTMRSLILALSYTRAFFYIIKLFGRILHLGPQAADYVTVEDFGFKDMTVREVRNTAE
ncbi:oxidoreductase [Aspergillus costaricaensis CBS 115574]|uniref:Oxidoreductase n=1 Tax=Aspergillus costaricaensis CBS 115574 TaxID=1448317 RepID=A0ACD1I691_9EURO|nr:oxidoreductase [Aspergillus costaricaensis CBS 115574]RAK85740.1 oxidoreductase [Aspergillus costaricaensis CBS 115574]